MTWLSLTHADLAVRTSAQRAACDVLLLLLLPASLVLHACADTDSNDLLDEVEMQRAALEEAPPFAGGPGAVAGGGAGATGGGTGALAGGDAGLLDASLPPIPDAGAPDATNGTDAGPPGGEPLGGGPGGLIGGLLGGGGLPQAFGHWKFDDCGPSPLLADSSPTMAHASRSPQVACATGISGPGAVLFDGKKGMINAAPNPAFAVGQRVTLAAWVKPKRVADGALVTKALHGSRAFELLLNNGNLVFRVWIDRGRKTKQIVSKAPIQPDRWTHVAAQFDGSFVRLFQNGTQVGQIAVGGTIADVSGSIELGNNQANQAFKGLMDDVWLSSAVVAAEDIAALSCIRAAPAIGASPSASGPRLAGTRFTYDVSLTNRDLGACSARLAGASALTQQPGITTVTFPQSLTLEPGESGQLGVHFSHSTDAEPGTTQFIINGSFVAFDGSFPVFDSVQTTVEYTVAAPTGCFVRTGRELLMRDLDVVEDPLRTTFDGPAEDPRTGAWTFGRLMEQLAPSDAEAPAMVERMFSTWLTDQHINGFNVAAKPNLRRLVLDSWPRTDGKLDLRRSPLRLLAIVNRIDSRNLAQGHAGEGRFVFGVIGPDGFAEQFTIIFEYRLPATTIADVQAWADQWHALGALTFPSEAYNAALQAITDRFTRRGSEPGRPNGSALAQLRSNEVAINNEFVWELREFELSASTHMLEPATVKLTPDNGFISGSALVADYVNQNESAVLSEKHDVPPLFEGQPFLGGSSFNDLNSPWTAPGIRDNEARHKFGLNTCNGCHSLVEANTGFLHVSPRDLGQVAALSPFMQGTILADPVTGASRALNDLQRRNDDLHALVCSDAAPAGAVVQRDGARTAGVPSRAAFLAKGIDRTH